MRLLSFQPIAFCQRIVVTGVRLFVLSGVQRSVNTEHLQIDGAKHYIIACNHQRGVDPFVIISSLPKHYRKHILPIKFMTKNKFYYTWWQPAAFLSGCFPARARFDNDRKGYGVDEAIRVGKAGFTIVIFPEGRVTTPGGERAHSGVSRILTALPQTELILCKIDWQKDEKDRYSVDLYYRNADETIDQSNPQQILDDIYSL